jgi:two-component system CheB/CheR fusion protein
VDLQIIPLKNLKERCYLILFAEAGRGASERESVQRGASKSPTRSHAQRPDAPRLARRRIAELERELAETRDERQSIQEEHGATNEELQAANEELQSANEELQSINEELETS